MQTLISQLNHDIEHVKYLASIHHHLPFGHGLHRLEAEGSFDSPLSNPRHHHDHRPTLAGEISL